MDQSVGDLTATLPEWPWPAEAPEHRDGRPREDEVHLWAIELGAARASWRPRAQLALRRLIAAYEHRDAGSVRIARSPLGKPFVAGALEFSLSHSGSLALIAFAWESPLGVDLELLERRSRPREIAIARRLWGEDGARRLAATGSDRRRRVFLEMWVDHEARAKLTGRGLRERPANGARACRTIPLALGGRAVAALATERTASELRCRRLRKPAALRSGRITRGYPWQGK